MTLDELKRQATALAEAHGIEGEPEWRPMGAQLVVRWRDWSATYRGGRDYETRWVVLRHGLTRGVSGFGPTLGLAHERAVADLRAYVDHAERLTIRNRLQRLGITVQPCAAQYRKALHEADGMHLGDFDAQGAVELIREREQRRET